MATKETDECYELIQSLSKAEKRYFKIQFSGAGHKEVAKYLALFDALASLKEFSKKGLLAEIKDPQLLRYYSKAKSHLIVAVLDSLRSYYRQNSLDEIIATDIAHARLLLQKGQFAYFEHQLQRVKQLCYDTDKLESLLVVLEIQESYSDSKLGTSQSVLQEISLVLEKLKKSQDIRILNRKVYALYLKHGMRPSEEEKKVLHTMVGVLQDATHTCDVRAAHIFAISSQALCYHCLGDNYTACETITKALALYNATPSKYHHFNRKEYFRTLGNMMTYSYNTRNYEYFKTTCTHLDIILASDKDDDELTFELKANHIFLEISLTSSYENFLRSVEYVEERQDLLPKINIIRQIDLIFNVALGYLKVNCLDDSLRWINKLFAVALLEERKEIYLYARLFEILLHWKLGNTSLVVSRTLSFKRHLQKNNKLGAFEKTVIKFINAAVYNNSTQGFAKAITTFSGDLAVLDSQQYSGMVAHYADLVQWFLKP